MVDCGRVKRRVWDLRAGTSKFEVGWISQASADQRAGRAGRTGPGHCYRLYSAAVFQDRFSKFEPPETETMPLDAMVLQLKCMGIPSVQGFPFPSPPPRAALVAAIRSLAALGILQLSKHHPATIGPRAGAEAAAAASSAAASGEEVLTPLGREVSQLPVSPPLAKMLVLASRGGQSLASWTCALVAAMTVDNPFLFPGRRKPARAAASSGGSAAAPGDSSDDDGVVEDGEDAAAAAADEAAQAERAKEQQDACRVAHAQVLHPHSDALSLLRLVGAHAFSCVDADSGRLDQGASSRWCREQFVRHKSLQEAHQLRRQLHAKLHRALASAAAPLEFEGTADSSEAAAAVQDDAELPPPASDSASSASSARAGAAASGGESSVQFMPHLPRMRARDETAVMQVVASGLLHRVMRRATADEAADLLAKHGLSLSGPGGGRLGSRVPYLPADHRLPHPIFVHPRSAACRDAVRDMPRLIVAYEIIQSAGSAGRPLLRGCTEIQDAWLLPLCAGTPLVALGKALPSPHPDYTPAADRVQAWHQPVFGDGAWKLPLEARALRDEPLACRVFARALLEGRALPVLKPFAAHLAAPAELLTKGGSQRRITALLAALGAGVGSAGAVTSMEALRACWHANPTFLLDEVAAWLDESRGAALRKAWPTIVKSASSGTSSRGPAKRRRPAANTAAPKDPTSIGSNKRTRGKTSSGD